jgi:hypothetical protein
VALRLEKGVRTAPNRQGKEPELTSAYMTKLPPRERDTLRFHERYNNKKGTHGRRKGNRQGMSRRQWIERYVVIKDKRENIHPMTLSPAQRRVEAMVLRHERLGLPVRIGILKARQQGISTYVAAFVAENSLRNEHSRALLMANKEKASTVIFDRVKLMLARIPKSDGGEWDVPLATENKTELRIVRPISSTIYIQSAEGRDPGRADTVPIVHLSESAFWFDSEKKALGVIQVVPDESNTYIFNESTANGNGGWFHDLFWSAWRAQQAPDWKPSADWCAVFIPWFIDQEYRWSHVNKRPLDKKLGAKIQESLDDDEKALLSMTYVRRGKGRVTVDLDQLAWRRWAIKNKCQGDLNKFHQEYPARPEEAFLASGVRFFDQKTIAAIRVARKEPVWRGELIDPEAEARMSRT